MALNRTYISDADEFIADLLKKKPELEHKQQELRNTWWDKDFIDPEEQRKFKKNTVPIHGYVYFDYSDHATKN
ncbi:MAG: DUF3460 family protein [Burkholderiales bacterium]|nr:DUF3460 family protein [Burkholderiales bacterium]